jgi:type II secretory pathway predicted ATPase ExeA
MVRDPWNFSTAAFDGSLEPATFHLGGPQEEALARIEWLVDERQRSGLVVGAEGSGKSHLAAMVVRRLAGLGAEATLLSLRGLSSGDWIEMLLERLPLDAPSRSEPLRPWQKLENRLRENTLMERTTAVVFDDLDHAPADAVEGIVRLVSAAEPRFARLIVVATSTPAGFTRLPVAIRQRASVRIELGPWDEDDVAGFLAAAIRRVGGGEDRFSPQAAATIARFAGGVPRTVCQLARLALVAAAGDGLEQIDAATVERVWRELAPTAGVEQPQETLTEVEDDGPPPANPRVRVVRRLWG